MEDCTFCQIYKDNEKVEYEDEYFFIQFDAYPVTAGHLEVIPKRHIESFFQLSEEEEWEQLQQALEKAKKLVEETNLKSIYEDFISEPLDQNSKYFSQEIIDKENWKEVPDAFNIGINEGREAGRTIDHLHIHLIPRYEGDVENPVGGVRNIIPEKADYKNRDTK